MPGDDGFGKKAMVGSSPYLWRKDKPSNRRSLKIVNGGPPLGTLTVTSMMIMYFHEDGILRGGGVEMCVEADSRRVCLELVAADEPCVTLENVVGVPSDCVLELSDVVDTAVGRASGGVRGAAEEAAGWVGDEATSGDSSEPEGRSRDVLRRTCTELRVGGDEGDVRVLPKEDNPIQASRVLGDFFLPCILDDELGVSMSMAMTMAPPPDEEPRTGEAAISSAFRVLLSAVV